MKTKYLPMILLSFFFAACEEEVVLDLDSIEKKLVVEARISNSEPMGEVILSYSQGFYDVPDSNRITNATVSLTVESTGESEQLTLIGDRYFSKNLQAQYGESYKLEIENGDQLVEVSAKMPPKVDITSVVFVPNPFDNSPDSLNVFVNVLDRVGEDNFFRLLVYSPGENDYQTFYVVDDTFGKDGLISMPIYFKTYAPGDTVITELRHLNKATYDYYGGLTENLGGSFNAIAPGNPVSNMPDEVFGIFAAWATDIDTFFVGKLPF
ncbi:MAG: DUF4249 domain-containing protein [Prolixibacteraceae bacterium]|nr:DUF4249 domain-containing protein [Prolixibacteraceae bacterium]